MALTSPVPQEVSDELRRVVRRWQQLPLDRALSCLPAVRALLDELAPLGGAGSTVPDLGPGVVMDQLTVLVYDACAAGAGSPVRERLSALRAALP